ncbi:MAG: diguanylate cyclase [Desulfobacterales bacterium]
MLKRIFHLPDKSENEHKDQRRLLLTFLGIGLTTLLVSAPLALEELGKFVYSGFLGLLLILLAFAYMNQLWLAKIIIPFVGFMIITRFIYGGGIHDEALGGYYFILLVVGLINGRRAMLLFGVLCTLAVIVFGVAETNDWIITRFSALSEPISVATTAFFLLGTTLALNYLVVHLNRAIVEAQRSESAQIKANEELRELQAVLEERVEQRTSDLDLSNQQLTIQLERVNSLQEKLRQEAIHDSLTGLFNRRFLDETLPLELARLKRENSPLTILMVDIDHFKNINDTYGHQIGDDVLQSLGNALKTSVRAGDIVCRYGGEEFILIFPGMNATNGRTQAEKLRVMIASQTVSGRDQLISVTISIGGSVFPHDGNSSDELISVADLALYRAKQTGRNRVEFAVPDDHAPDVKGATS